MIIDWFIDWLSYPFPSIFSYFHWLIIVSSYLCFSRLISHWMCSHCAMQNDRKPHRTHGTTTPHHTTHLQQMGGSARLFVMMRNVCDDLPNCSCACVVCVCAWLEKIAECTAHNTKYVISNSRPTHCTLRLVNSRMHSTQHKICD